MFLLIVSGLVVSAHEFFFFMAVKLIGKKKHKLKFEFNSQIGNNKREVIPY